MDTAFYIAGGALVLIAILISFFGMRNENFPSDGALRAGVAFVFAVVAVTAVLAVEASKEEAQSREDEQNREAAVEEQSATDVNQDAGAEDDGSSSTPAPVDATGAAGTSGASGAGDAMAGAQVFTDQGCGGCHSLAANSSTGQIGPNLDEALVDKDEVFIETSIVDPGDYVEDGFSDGIMPTTYADDIPPDQLADLVSYLYESTRSK